MTKAVSLHSKMQVLLPSSVKLAIAIATEVALLSLFPTTNTNTRKSINKASYEANFQYLMFSSTKPLAALALLDGWRWRRMKIAICWPRPVLQTRALVKIQCITIIKSNLWLQNTSFHPTPLRTWLANFVLVLIIGINYSIDNNQLKLV